MTGAGRNSADAVPDRDPDETDLWNGRIACGDCGVVSEITANIETYEAVRLIRYATTNDSCAVCGREFVVRFQRNELTNEKHITGR